MSADTTVHSFSLNAYKVKKTNNDVAMFIFGEQYAEHIKQDCECLIFKHDVTVSFQKKFC